MKKILNLILLLLLFTSPIYGQVLDSTLSQGKFLGKDLSILRSKKKLTIKEVMTSNDFHKSNQEVPRFGYVYDDIWAKLEIQNELSPNKEFFFEVRGPMEGVTAYLVKDSEVIKTSKAGMFLFPEEETFVSGHAYPVVSFQLPLGASTIYFSETAVAPHFPIVSYDKAGFESRLKTHNSTLNLLFGLSLAFFLFLVIICLFVNGKCEIFLALGFLSFFILIGFVTGLFRVIYFNYGGSTNSILSNYLYLYPLWPVFCALYCLSLSLFSIFHLGKENFFNTRTSKVITLIALFSQLLLGVVSYFDTVLGMNLFATSFNITIFQAIYWSIRKNRLEGRRELLIATVGWFIYCGLSTFQLFYYLGISDNTFFAVWGTIIGFFALLSLLTISLVERNRVDLYHTIEEKQDAFAKLEQNFNELRKRDEIIQVFSTPRINVEINLGLNPLKFEPKYLNTTVVFFDMRGFTKLSESLELMEVYHIINEYMGKIIDGIQNEGGFTDKLIGDAIMAQFENPDKCLDAIRTIRNTLSGLNRKRISQNLLPVSFGTGISYGRVLTANFGSSAKMDRTIIGDVVNKSSRIESLTKIYHVDVLLDGDFYDVLTFHNDMRLLGYSKVAGRRNSVKVYEYFGHNRSDVREVKNANAEQIKKALTMALDGSQANQAKAVIDELIAKCPKHSYRENEIMDMTLFTIRESLSKNFEDAKKL